MAKQIGLKNTTLIDIELTELGETVPVNQGSPEQILDMSNTPAVVFRKVANLESLIVNGDIIVFDGMADLGYTDGYHYLVDDVVADVDGFWHSNRRRFNIKVNQTAHGFVVGDIIYIDVNGSLQKAIATSNATSSSAYIVSEIIDVDNLYGGNAGAIVTPDVSSIVEGLPLTVGAPYFLSASQAGKLTLTPPSNAGDIVKIIGVAGSTTELGIFNYPGYENGTQMSSAEITTTQSGTAISNRLLGWLPAVLDVVADPSTLTPLAGDRYIVGAGTGVWLGKDNNIAEYNSTTSSWYYTMPANGNFSYDKSLGKLIKFDGTVWVNAIAVSTISLQDDGIAVTSTPHNTLNFVEMNVTDNGDGSANVQNVFGSNFQKAEDLTVSTTLSTAPIVKLSMTTPVLPIGTYRIGVAYGWNHNATTSDFEAQLMEDGIQKGQIHKQESKDSAGSFGSTGTSQKLYTNRTYYSSYGTASTHTFDLEFRTDKGSAASSIWDTSIEIWRVS